MAKKWKKKCERCNEKKGEDVEECPRCGTREDEDPANDPIPE